MARSNRTIALQVVATAVVTTVVVYPLALYDAPLAVTVPVLCVALYVVLDSLENGEETERV